MGGGTEQTMVFAWEGEGPEGAGGDLRGRGFGRWLGGHRLHGENYDNGLLVDNMIVRLT